MNQTTQHPSPSLASHTCTSARQWALGNRQVVKALVFTLCLFASLPPCLIAQNFYGHIDGGLAHRTQPIIKDGKIYSSEKANTAILNAGIGNMFHIESNNKTLNILTELTTRIPLLDNTNSISIGILAGPCIPIGSSNLVPMLGAYWHQLSTTGKAYTINPTLRYIAAAKNIDANWYIEASYINRSAAITAGAIIRNNKLF